MDVDERAIFTQFERAVLRLPNQDGGQVIPFPIEVIVENAGVTAIEAISRASTYNRDRVVEGDWSEPIRHCAGCNEINQEKKQQFLRSTIHTWILIFV